MTDILSRRDVQFLLNEWLDVQRLTERDRYSDQTVDDWNDVLTLAEQIAEDQFQPHNRKADLNEPSIGEDGKVALIPEVAEALEVLGETGLMAAAMPEEVGGMSLPATVSSAIFAWLHAANVGTTAYPMLTAGAANLLIANGSEEQVETWVKPMVEGRFHGTMCLSETQAGSSLSDITTKAIPQDDGTYRVFGNKMWISAGSHELGENIVHLVLAKIPGSPAGVKGISLFIVPRFLLNEDGSVGERNDVVLAGVNHKMGFRGTVNTVLGFGEGEYKPGGEAGAIGYLIGEPNRGLAYMFHMMNEARIGVGLGATALGYTGYLKSLRYARERPQGRPLASKDPADPQIPISEHTDVKRMLLAQKSYVEGALGLELYCSSLVDDEMTAPDEEDRARATLLLEILTPIAKSWPSQWCLEANSLAIQVHGGYGYAREYDVEQHYRDNRLNPIHEGTHGIQALDLLGRKVTMQGGAAFGALFEKVTATIDEAKGAGGEASELADQLQAALGRLAETTGKLWADRDPELALANATVYLEAAGHVVVAWIWLQQFLASAGKDGDFYEGKRQATRYFFRFELPKTGPQFDLLASLDRTTLEMEDAWF
ncbi:MAG: acyl-CoA dehydrogenase [Solirubrobacterales bacterium]|nr:acyl-CoA dehydrogenase [Solirubrobacterales bacterium]OJU94989.1 MAG: acyl-CoA dehydrogenase [Solirubrobacterales bacterium 67-14]